MAEGYSDHEPGPSALNCLNEAVDASMFRKVILAAIFAGLPIGFSEKAKTVSGLLDKMQESNKFSGKEVSYLQAILEIVGANPEYVRALKAPEEDLLECRQKLRFSELIVKICQELKDKDFNALKLYLEKRFTPTNKRTIEYKEDLFRILLERGELEAAVDLHVYNEQKHLDELEKWMKEIWREDIIMKLIEPFRRCIRESSEGASKTYIFHGKEHKFTEGHQESASKGACDSGLVAGKTSDLGNSTACYLSDRYHNPERVDSEPVLLGNEQRTFTPQVGMEDFGEEVEEDGPREQQLQIQASDHEPEDRYNLEPSTGASPIITTRNILPHPVPTGQNTSKDHVAPRKETSDHDDAVANLSNTEKQPLLKGHSNKATQGTHSLRKKLHVCDNGRRRKACLLALAVTLLHVVGFSFIGGIVTRELAFYNKQPVSTLGANSDTVVVTGSIITPWRNPYSVENCANEFIHELDIFLLSRQDYIDHRMVRMYTNNGSFFFRDAARNIGELDYKYLVEGSKIECVLKYSVDGNYNDDGSYELRIFNDLNQWIASLNPKTDLKSLKPVAYKKLPISANNETNTVTLIYNVTKSDYYFIAANAPGNFHFQYNYSLQVVYFDHDKLYEDDLFECTATKANPCRFCTGDKHHLLAYVRPSDDTEPQTTQICISSDIDKRIYIAYFLFTCTVGSTSILVAFCFAYWIRNRCKHHGQSSVQSDSSRQTYVRYTHSTKCNE